MDQLNNNDNDGNSSVINYTDNIYEVEHIAKKGKGVDGKTYYQIKWAGYPEEENTWELAENLSSIADLIQEYEYKYSKRLKKYHPIPLQVNYFKFHDKKLYANVTWNKNKDGTCYPNNMVPYDQIRSKHPLLLIDYYETQMKRGKQNVKLLEDDSIMNN